MYLKTGTGSGGSRSYTSIQSFEFEDTEDEGTQGRWDGFPEKLGRLTTIHSPHHHVAVIIPFKVKFGLLFCKDIKLASRRKKIFGIEIIIPIISICLLSFYVGYLNNPAKIENYTPFKPTDLNIPFLQCNRILLAPKTTFTDEVAKRLKLIPKLKPYNFLVLDTHGVNKTNSDVCGAVVFHTKYNGPIKGNDYPKHITYEIRLRPLQKTLLTLENKDRPYSVVSHWSTDEIYPREITTGPREKENNYGGKPGYYSEGFLYLQQKIDTILIQLIYTHHFNPILNNSNPYEIKIFPELMRFPYPPYNNADMVSMVDRFLPIVLLIGISSVVILCNTWLLVTEKAEAQWFLKMFGISNSIQWGSWILREMIIHCMVILIITGILFASWHWNGFKRIGFIDKADVSIFYIFLFAFYFNNISMSIFISVFFSNANSALTAAGFVNLFYYLQYIYVEPNYEHLHLWTKYLLCILPPSGVAFGCKQLAIEEANHGGVKWVTLFDLDFGLGHVILMMIFGGFIIIIFSHYIRNIIPTVTNEFGLPFHYFLKSWFWKGNLPPDERDAPIDDKAYQNSEWIEKESRNQRREIQIQRLSKCFPRDVGIFNITMNFLVGETTVILGGHLSGKSTLTAVVTGNISMTRGSVKINKHNVQTDLSYARTNLGLCPQENLLYSYLSVEEIISFYLQLKGVYTISEVFEEVGRLAKDLEIDVVRKIMVEKLSVTQKRMVHIAIAFSGGSKVIILDEPTQYMDHASKRIAWRFIESEKENRCIVVLTKSSEEAYYLSDKLAILVNGEICSKGSLNFMNSKFGGGYNLSIIKAENYKRIKLRNILRQHVSDSRVVSDEPKKIEFFLPTECTPFFPNLFTQLENEKNELGLESYKISHIPTEEVFRRAGKQKESQSKQEFKRRHTVFRTNSDQIFSDPLKKRNYNCILFCLNQFIQLLLKNIRFFIRRWKWFIIPVILSISILIIGVSVIKTDPFKKILPPLYLNKQYITATNVSKVLVKCGGPTSILHICLIIKEVIHQLSLKAVDTDEITDNNILEEIYESYDTTIIPIASTYLLVIESISQSNQEIIRIYFNNQPLHIPPIAMNIISNIILKVMVIENFHEVPNINNNDYKISIINYPLEYTNIHKLGLNDRLWSSSFFFGFTMSIAMTFFIPIFIIMPIREKIFKHLQIMAGVNLIIFWITKLLWDIFCFIIICILICIIIYQFKMDGFNNLESIQALCGFIFIYGICSLGIINCMVPLFKSSGLKGYFYTWFLFFVTGPVPMSIILQHDSISTVLHNIFLYLPNYTFGMGVYHMYSFSRYKEECSKIEKEDMIKLCHHSNESSHGCCEIDKTHHSMSIKGVGYNDVVIISMACLTHLIAFVMDSQFYHTFKVAFIRWRLKSKAGNKIDDYLDEYDNDEYDILTSKDTNFEHIDPYNTDLNIKNLSNLPGKGNIHNMDLSIRKNECFGILGLEGCGHDNILNLMTGLSIPATGDISIEGGAFTLTKNYKKYLKHFGYCEHTPSLMEELTGKEILILFGTLRKVPNKLLHPIITSLSLRLLLIHELENLVSQYNPSNMKKLATAITLIGTPDFMIFDEPMIEIDQSTREHIINTLEQSKERSCIIITSGNVDICETLCDRLAIMVNGKIRCTGSPKYLKEAFCMGYTITAKLVPDDPYLYDKDYEISDPDEPTIQNQLLEYKNPIPEIQLQSSMSNIPSININSGSFLDSKRSFNRIIVTSQVNSQTQLNNKKVPPSPSGSETNIKQEEVLIEPVVILATDSKLLAQRRKSKTKDTIHNQNDRVDIDSSSGINHVPKHSVFHDGTTQLHHWEKELIPLMDFIEQSFPDAQLVNIYPCFVSYHIQDDIDLSYIFEQMEKAREEMELESYTVGEATLEQICINFTGAQKLRPRNSK